MRWEGKNVLITGISGFVGSYLAKYLVEQKANVHGLVIRKSDGTMPKNLADRGISQEVKLFEGNLSDSSAIASALDKAQPDVIFHLGAQSFIPRSFSHPLETSETNCIGTANLLEVIRIKDIDPTVIFAGSSEEYGLVIYSREQYNHVIKKYGSIFPEPKKIPELPINEENPLRPMSPYAVSKVYGDYLMRDYFYSYRMKTVVSRAFNHEGAGRGIMFVTSAITNQVMKLKFGETDRIRIGNVNAFRDWSHVDDIVRGYCLLAEKGKKGEVYNQGAERTNSVLSYILLSLESAGYKIEKIKSVKGNKIVKNPLMKNSSKLFGLKFEKTLIDVKMVEEGLEFELSDKGIVCYTSKGKVLVEFDPLKFRYAEVPVLLSNTGKIRKIGFTSERKLGDIISDQLNYFLTPKNRNLTYNLV